MLPISSSGQSASPQSHRALQVYFKSSEQKICLAESNLAGLTPQEIYTRLAYNRLYLSESITDSLDGNFYKHQELVSRQMFINDSGFVMDDPGTGKTITYLHTMVELIRARAITRFLIINYSSAGNKVAIRSLQVIYEKLYAKEFKLSFTKFIRTYVRSTTLHKLGKYHYESHMGIVVDEAHNMLSDNEPNTQKLTNLTQFIQRISQLKGIKLMLLTATPLQGDVGALGKFRSVLLRDPEERIESIPSSLISYTQINYSHLQVRQMLNESSDKTILRGRRSFELSNGVIYPFLLYCQKPSPAQIADFANLAISGSKAPFQSREKPRIVSSLPRNGSQQSAIVDSIVQLAEKTSDGTIIVYCDLVDDGSKAVARILNQKGWQKYSARDSKAHSNHRSNQLQSSGQVFKLETELAEKSLKCRRLNSELIPATQEELSQLNQLYSSMSESVGVKEVFKEFLDFYRDELQLNQTHLEELRRLKVECERLRKEIAALKQHSHSTHTSNLPGWKYMIYSSSMSAQDNEAFKLFNSEANWDGSLIKMIIGSKVMRDGVDIYHNVQTHIIIPEWRISGFIQAQHRGIRSSGHNYLIHHRAIKMVEKSKCDPSIPPSFKLTYQEAREKIISEKITIEIYNHFVDMELLEEEDISSARYFIDENDELAEMTDLEVLKLLRTGSFKVSAGEAIINAAVQAYREVGSEMMNLHSSALDYKLNVNRDARLTSAITPKDIACQSICYEESDLLGVADVELFFSEVYSNKLISEITKLLLERHYLYTDEIFKHYALTNSSGFKLEPRIIATAIIELSQHRKKVYSELLGVWLFVKLYETRDESILYLTTTEDISHRDLHPLNVISPTIGFSVNSKLRRTPTKITTADLALPKSVESFYKLKDLIEKAMNSDSITQVEHTFLIQMSSYWAFSWKALTSPNLNRETLSVYVFEDHILKPSMNNLAKDLSLYEYRVSLKEWRITSTTSLKDTLLVRYGTLVEMYRHYSFFKLPEFEDRFPKVKRESQQDTNGIIFIKGYYNPRNTEADWFENLLSGEDVLRAPVVKNVLVKKFSDNTSRGKQIIHSMPGRYGDRNQVIQKLKEITSSDISLFFFLYDKDTSVRGSQVSIFDIKRAEIEVMMKAVNGTPTPRFQIYAIETAITDPIRKKQIYCDIYRLPSFI